MRTPLESLENVTDIAMMPGNYNCNSYMHGMANGLILARSILRGEEKVPYLDAPKEWLDSKGEQSNPPETVSAAAERIVST